jgi:hypothetical protein
MNYHVLFSSAWKEFHLFFSRVPQGENSSGLGLGQEKHINNSTLTSIFTKPLLANMGIPSIVYIASRKPV